MMMQEPPAKRIRQEGEQALTVYGNAGVSNDATDELLQPSIPTQRLYGELRSSGATMCYVLYSHART